MSRSNKVRYRTSCLDVLPHRSGSRSTHLPLSLLLRCSSLRILHLRIRAGLSDHREDVEDDRLVLHLLRIIDAVGHNSLGNPTTLVLVSIIDQQYRLGPALGYCCQQNWDHARGRLEVSLECVRWESCFQLLRCSHCGFGVGMDVTEGYDDATASNRGKTGLSPERLRSVVL